MNEIAEYLHEEWRRGDSYFHGETWEAEVSVLYDHDYEFHILLHIHPYGQTECFHALFYIGTESSCLVKQWDTAFPPHLYAETAEIVEGWAEICAEVSRSF